MTTKVFQYLDGNGTTESGYNWPEPLRSRGLQALEAKWSSDHRSLHHSRQG